MKTLQIRGFLRAGLVAGLSAALVAQAGSAVRLFYDGISTASSVTAVRTSIATLTNSARFPEFPTFREQIDDFTALPGLPLRAGLQGKDNSGSDYGSYVRGYLEAPETGDYLFNIASDDSSALFLSSDHTEANRRQVAFESESGAPLFGGPRQDQRLSAPIRLVRGQKYFFEVLHKQAGGGSYIQVGWQRPDGVQEIIPALHLAQYPVDAFLGTGSQDRAPGFNASGLNAGNLPTTVTVAEGDELVLQTDVIAAQPTTWSWTRNGSALEGENLSFLRFRRTPASLNGARIQASVVNRFGNLQTATTTVTVTPDTTPPSVLLVETAGNPNLLRVTFSEPVERASATNLANYSIRGAGGAAIPASEAVLLADDKTVEISGTFGFRVGVNYDVTVRGVRDQAVTANTLSPNPTVAAFVFSAPTGTTYTFNSGRPNGFSFFGQADVVPSGSHDGSGYLRLTDAVRNQSGAVVVTARRDVDQVRIRFRTRIADGSSLSGVDDPGDGFSVNVAADLPLGTLGQPEEGFTPDVPGNRLGIAFDTHADSTDDLASIRVLLNNQVVTNILTGTNGLAFRGVPSINSADGHWADVDIDIRRNGLLTLRYDGVTLLENLPTAFEIVGSAQVGFAARTRAWFQTHWIDDLNINYGEGDVGDVAIDAASVLGGRFPEGSDIRLSVLPTGAGPFGYQWFRNGNPIPDASGRVLVLPGVSANAGRYSVRVTNAFSSVTSSTGNVVVLPDTAPPAVASVRGVAGGVNQVRLTFDEPLDPDTVASLSTWSSSLFRISEAVLQVDGRSVVLRTTALRVGVEYPLTVSGLRDRSAQANPLTTTLRFTAALTYQDEVLADNPVRYFRFEETSGTVAATATTAGDQLNTNGVYQNFPALGVPTLVPSATGEFAAHFTRAQTNYVTVPNGGDLNDFRGPWPKKSYEFWFKADSTPGTAPAGANAADTQFHTTAGIWEEGGNLRSIAVYLWRNPAKLNPGEAELTFHSYNDTPDGPGAPYGLRQYPAVFVTHTIRTNTVYHVVAVQDGSTDSRDGELRLYVNGELVSRSTNGVGQIYNHNGDIQIARGNSRSHLNISANYGSLDGSLDEVSVFNTILSADRIRAHFRAGTGESLSTVAPETRVVSVDAGGHPNRVSVVFNQPVSAATATDLGRYTLRTAGGATIPVQSAVLLDDLVTVRLSGAFSFAQGATYQLSVSGVADILAPSNVVAPVSVPFSFSTLGPVGIANGADLSDRQVVENGTVRFSVSATGQPPFRYQWLKDNAPIDGATGPTLAFNVPVDASGSYTVRVSNEFSETVSEAARLTVLRDTLPPALVSVRAFAGSLHQVRLRFSEPLLASIATNLATYGLTPVGGSGATLLGASLSADGHTVILQTTTQSDGQVHRVTVAGIADRAAQPNRLSTAATVTTGVGYREEILSEGAVRYWTFDETSGTEFNTLASRFDTARENLVGTLINGPQVGVAGLVPNLPGSTAFRFLGNSPSNHVFLPNGRDINAILGPWAKRTHLLSFRADRLPRVTITTNIVDNQFVVTTNVASPALYAHDRIAIYLYGTQESDDPTEAQIVFRAHNTTSEGPGTPWGGTTLATSKHVIATVRRGQTYHLAAVLDGSPTSFTGELKLYLDGQLVGAVGGIGQIYKHPNTTPTIGIGSFRTHDGNTQSVDYTASNFNARFDGVIDEFSLVPKALSAARIAELYAISRTAPAGAAVIETPSAFTDIRVEGGSVTVRWEGPARLLRSDHLDGPYSQVSGATSPYAESAGASQRFYRLQP
jgi:hypothetical protein